MPTITVDKFDPLERDTEGAIVPDQAMLLATGVKAPLFALMLDTDESRLRDKFALTASLDFDVANQVRGARHRC